MPERKRLTLAATLILKQVARALDDVADMFVRHVKKMHNKAEAGAKNMSEAFHSITCRPTVPIPNPEPLPPALCKSAGSENKGRQSFD